MAGAKTVENKSKVAAAAGGAGNGGDMFEDPRIEALMILVSERSDNVDIIEKRYSTVVAQGSKLIDHEKTVELYTRNDDARLAFAEFASSFLGRQEELTQQKFEELFAEFKSSQASDDRVYHGLSKTGKEKYMDAILATKEEFLTAFGAMTVEPDFSTLSVAREASLSFSAMPSTLDEVNACFDSFLKDDRFAGVIGGRSLKEQFFAFTVARATLGVVESKESAAAISQYAVEFGLCA
jgi:hypothetical protein